MGYFSDFRLGEVIDVKKLVRVTELAQLFAECNYMFSGLLVNMRKEHEKLLIGRVYIYRSRFLKSEDRLRLGLCFRSFSGSFRDRLSLRNRLRFINRVNNEDMLFYILCGIDIFY